jgi:predicted alpha/beta superfamily hydrolase
MRARGQHPVDPKEHTMMSASKRWMTAQIFVLAAMSTSVLYAEGSGDPIPIAHRYAIESKILGETRQYFVHKPPKYDYRERAYPVLILLDGETNLNHTSSSADFLAENGRIPEMLVVGIPNTNRSRDLTPPLTTPNPNMPNTGGGGKFLAFIGDELIPEIERRYRTRPYRVIVGHSLGGLFAVYALNERPELFNAYLPISPSLWYDDQALVQRTASMLASTPDLRADVYMTIGNEDGNMLGSFHRLSAVIAESKPKKVRWQTMRSPDETHGSIPFLSTYDGLQALFDGWFIADPIGMYEQSGLAAIDKHYVKLSAKMGFTVPVPLRPFITLHHYLEGQKRMDEAVRVVERAMELYPKDAPGHFELARLYVATKDEALARQSLRRALDLHPGMQPARDMLRQLKAEPEDAKIPMATQALLSGEYAGPEDELRISMRDEKLVVEYSTGTQGCELRPASADRYYCVDKDVDLLLERASDSAITKLVEQHSDYRIVRRKVH